MFHAEEKTKNHFTINKNLKNEKNLKAKTNPLTQWINSKNNHTKEPRVQKQITHSKTYDPPLFDMWRQKKNPSVLKNNETKQHNLTS